MPLLLYIAIIFKVFNTILIQLLPLLFIHKESPRLSYYVHAFISSQIVAVGSVIPGSASGARVTAASVIDTANDNLYTFIMNDKPMITTLNLKSNTITASPNFSLKREYWALETLFQAVWVPKLSQVVVLLQGKNSGFDQIVAVDTNTGVGTLINGNLASENLFFTCDTHTKSCDNLQTAAYDAIEDRLYFQATEIKSTDDVGTTVLMYVDLAAKFPYIDTGLNPFTFGYMGFHFVSVQP